MVRTLSLATNSNFPTTEPFSPNQTAIQSFHNLILPKMYCYTTAAAVNVSIHKPRTTRNETLNKTSQSFSRGYSTHIEVHIFPFHGMSKIWRNESKGEESFSLCIPLKRKVGSDSSKEQTEALSRGKSNAKTSAQLHSLQNFDANLARHSIQPSKCFP